MGKKTSLQRGNTISGGKKRKEGGHSLDKIEKNCQKNKAKS